MALRLVGQEFWGQVHSRTLQSHKCSKSTHLSMGFAQYWRRSVHHYPMRMCKGEGMGPPRIVESTECELRWYINQDANRRMWGDRFVIWCPNARSLRFVPAFRAARSAFYRGERARRESSRTIRTRLPQDSEFQPLRRTALG